MKFKLFLLHVMTSDFGAVQQRIKFVIYCFEVGVILVEGVETC